MIGRLATSARRRVADHIQTRLTNTRDRIAARFTLPDKYKGGILEKWARYWRQLFVDYGEVAAGIVQFHRTHPIRAAIYAATGTTLYQCYKWNPTQVEFMRELRYRTADLLLVDGKVQRIASREHLRHIERLLNESQLRHLNLGIASLMWRADYDQQLALYRSTCTYTLPHWRTFGERIVDVGFCGRWWILHKRMEDYDVREDDGEQVD